MRLRRELVILAEFRCAACCQERPEHDLELDHIRPLHRGGAAWDPGNLQVLCRDCHRKKTDTELGRRPETADQREWSRYAGELANAGR